MSHVTCSISKFSESMYSNTSSSVTSQSTTEGASSISNYTKLVVTLSLSSKLTSDTKSSSHVMMTASIIQHPMTQKRNFQNKMLRIMIIIVLYNIYYFWHYAKQGLAYPTATCTQNYNTSNMWYSLNAHLTHASSRREDGPTAIKSHIKWEKNEILSCTRARTLVQNSLPGNTEGPVVGSKLK
jgi:dipeptide/tripeptide permease